MVRVTSVVGQTRSSISVLMDSTLFAQPPFAPGTDMRCLSLPSLPTTRQTRAVSSLNRWLKSLISLNASAILPGTPVQSDGRRTEKSPPLYASRTERSCRVRSVDGGSFTGTVGRVEGKRVLVPSFEVLPLDLFISAWPWSLWKLRGDPEPPHAG